jgi:hypothetical protein
MGVRISEIANNEKGGVVNGWRETCNPSQLRTGCPEGGGGFRFVGGIADHFGGRDQMVDPELELACVSLFWRDLPVDLGIDGVEQQSGKTSHAGDHIESGGTSR